jgi:hypothetical protein
MYTFGNIKSDNLTDMIRSDKFNSFKTDFNNREGQYICNPDVCDLNANYLCRGGCATRSAYSKIDPKTGLITQNTMMEAYSKGREDPLCPGWTVLAQKQGVLKEGLYEKVLNDLLNSSQLSAKMIDEIKQRGIKNFNDLRGVYK